MPNYQQYCTFELDRFYLGVDVRDVQEVLRYRPMTRVPLAPNVVQGLVNVRGQIVIAIDLRRRLQLPSRSDDQLPTNVIVHTPAGPVSLLVDQVCDVLELKESTLQPPPDTLDESTQDLIHSVCMLPDRILMILSLEHITRFQLLTGTDSRHDLPLGSDR